MENHIAIQKYDSPCGMLLLAAYGNQLCMCDWENNPHRKLTDRKLRQFFQAEFTHTRAAIITETAKQLDEYFENKRDRFSIPLIFTGTDFQNTVWDVLRTVPYGSTYSYQEMANIIGRKKPTRAVANAIGANPISIIVPCHRIIGSNNTLTGYAGGLNAKQFLLTLENA